MKDLSRDEVDPAVYTAIMKRILWKLKIPLVMWTGGRFPPIAQHIEYNGNSTLHRCMVGRLVVETGTNRERFSV